MMIQIKVGVMRRDTNLETVFRPMDAPLPRGDVVSFIEMWVSLTEYMFLKL